MLVFRSTVCRWSLAKFVLVLGLFVYVFADHARAERRSVQDCRGTSMLSEFRDNNPVAYNKIVASAKSRLNEGAIFWRISRQDREPSYLLGTLHLTDKRVTTLSPVIKEAIVSSKVVALEVADLSPQATATAIAQARNLVIFTDGTRLDRLLSPEEFEAAKKQLSSIGLPAIAAPVLKPWVVSMALAVSTCERNKIKSGQLVLDSTIAALARKNNIPVVGLETIQSQLKAISSISIPEQIKLLRTSLAYVDRANDLAETMITLYQNRRIGLALPLQSYLAREAGIEVDKFGEFQNKLLIKRNREMRVKALPLLANGGAFIAVGALHLVGETGLVALFRDAGYTVTPIE